MRYSSYGSYDDQPLVDGDEGFIGMNTRVEPTQLENGFVSSAKNMRFDQGIASTRKGSTLFTDRTLGSGAVLLDCIPVDGGGADDHVLIAENDNAYIYNESTLVSTITYPGLNLSYAKLVNTRTNTLLFQGKGPTLPFQANSATLGDSVLRLDKSANKFRYWKENNLVSITKGTGTHTLVVTDSPSLVKGEKFVISSLAYGPGIINNWNGHAWEVVSIADKTITFKTASATEPTNTSSWTGSGGMIWSLDDQCPPADFATWAGSRLVVPIGKDELAISSPLSTHDFPVFNRLVIGSEDSGNITALEPLSDDSLLVFKNHSIYGVTGVYDMKGATDGGTLSISRVTDQLGCIARDTIQIIGGDVVFLSPQGIYALALNSQGQGAIGLPVQAVRVTDIALSRDIDSLVDGIDQATASATFHRGRYYLYDGSDILVYNTLLSTWESVDSVIPGVKKLLTINKTKARLLAFHSSSTLLELESSGTGTDVFKGGTENIESFIETRAYRSSTFEQKHYRRGQVSWKALENASSFKVDATLENPDSISTNINESNIAQASFNSRFGLSSRGESIKFKISNNSNGRIEVKRVLVEASPGSRQTTKFS
jgi:hypothetical protein